MLTRFADRHDAGRRLGTLLTQYAGRPDVVVLALPRGGVPVGYEVARTLGAPLEVFVVRKVGVPGHEELAMGALATGDVEVRNYDIIRTLGIGESAFARAAERERAELVRREQLYRGSRPFPDLAGRTVILVDDGLATGATMRAAVESLQRLDPARLVIAVPTAAPDVCAEFATLVDDIVCAITPEPFHAVGGWYADFTPTSDAEVRALLDDAAHPLPGPGW